MAIVTLDEVLALDVDAHQAFTEMLSSFDEQVVNTLFDYCEEEHTFGARIFFSSGIATKQYDYYHDELEECDYVGGW